ncbi:MAG: DNA-directed RNA polymerase subunit omega [Hyphomicrobiaceae bacterium]|jgi:DNA-directed RNA polymerase subunit omega
MTHEDKVKLMARVTIEDCLEQVPNRFRLSTVATQRAKMLLKGARPLVESPNKEIVTALREIAAGIVTIEGEDTPESDESEG